MIKTETTGLEITFAGIKFTSPIGVGAIGMPFGKNITPESHASILLKHVEAGAGYIEVPGRTIATEETLRRIKQSSKPFDPPYRYPPEERVIKVTNGVEGLYTNIWPGYIDPEISVERTKQSELLMQILMKKKPKDTRIIVNVAGYGDLPDSWVDCAKWWENLGADLIELNVSCPAHPSMKGAVEDFEEKQFALRWYGSIIGEMPEVVESITSGVAKAVNIPVGVKLSPETGLLRVVDLTKRIKNAGGKWIQSVNCGITIAPPDIYNQGKPIYPFTDGNPFVGTSGSWLRLTSYKHIAAISRFVHDLDIAASGGIMTPEQCVEAIMLGARQIQLCTGIMMKGRKLIKQCNNFIKSFMAEQGYSTVEEMVGLGQKFIKYVEETNRSVGGPFVAKIDEDKCTKCGICTDQFCVALARENGQVKVHGENCTGCGSCMVSCQYDAIKLVMAS